SSRRRHTRWPRDWSSDVCSSDLTPEADGTTALHWAARAAQCSAVVPSASGVLTADFPAGVARIAFTASRLPALTASTSVSDAPEIGRASCRERGEISWFAVAGQA